MYTVRMGEEVWVAVSGKQKWNKNEKCPVVVFALPRGCLFWCARELYKGTTLDTCGTGGAGHAGADVCVFYRVSVCAAPVWGKCSAELFFVVKIPQGMKQVICTHTAQHVLQRITREQKRCVALALGEFVLFYPLWKIKAFKHETLYLCLNIRNAPQVIPKVVRFWHAMVEISDFIILDSSWCSRWSNGWCLLESPTNNWVQWQTYGTGSWAQLNLRDISSFQYSAWPHKSSFNR